MFIVDCWLLILKLENSLYLLIVDLKGKICALFWSNYLICSFKLHLNTHLISGRFCCVCLLIWFFRNFLRFWKITCNFCSIFFNKIRNSNNYLIGSSKLCLNLGDFSVFVYMDCFKKCKVENPCSLDTYNDNPKATSGTQPDSYTIVSLWSMIMFCVGYIYSDGKKNLQLVICF